jgi:serine/threonine-protein kinase
LLPCSTATGKVGDAPPVLAVLPFAHHGAGLEAECFSDGITEELINALSRLPRIRVIARTTAFQFKGKAGDIREIGTTLGATAVLEGSVRMAGNRVRISTQLVSVADGCDLWAERFDRTMEDIFAVQDEIAQAISRKLQARFQDQTDSTIIPKVTAHPEAYRLYLRGRFHVRNRTAEGLAEAATYFRQAIELDPAFASAWSGLAGALLQTAFWGAMPPEESGPQIRAAAGEALRIDPESGEAHAALGAVSAAFDWNWNEAKQLFRRAMELEPGNPLIRSSYVAYILAPLKMLDEAVEIQKANLVLDPLSAGFFTTAAIIEMLRGRQAQAVQYATKALAISPKLLEPHILLGNHSLEQGDVARALEHYLAAKDSAPEDPYALSMAAAAFSRAGRRDLAAGIQEQLQGLERTRYVPPVHKARVHMALDQAEDALALLELAVKRRDNMLIFLNVFPVFEPVRTHPRFLHMLEQVGLPAAAGSIA